MPKLNAALRILCALAALAPVWSILLSQASNAQGVEARHDLAIVIGGRLYDNWFLQLMLVPPQSCHPSYPADGPASAADSWRCMTCHGWDYEGSDGSASPHRPSTPIFTGISNSTGAEPSQVRAILNDSVHRFTKQVIPPLALDALAHFVSAGQIDIGGVINPADGRSTGIAKRGKRAFKTVCALCHGLKGDALALESVGVRKTIGTLARFDPWRLCSSRESRE